MNLRIQIRKWVSAQGVAMTISGRLVPAVYHLDALIRPTRVSALRVVRQEFSTPCTCDSCTFSRYSLDHESARSEIFADSCSVSTRLSSISKKDALSSKFVKTTREAVTTQRVDGVEPQWRGDCRIDLAIH